MNPTAAFFQSIIDAPPTPLAGTSRGPLGKTRPPYRDEPAEEDEKPSRNATLLIILALQDGGWKTSTEIAEFSNVSLKCITQRLTEKDSLVRGELVKKRKVSERPQYKYKLSPDWQQKVLENPQLRYTLRNGAPEIALLGILPEAHRSTIPEKILYVMRDGKWWTHAQLVETMKLKPHSINNALEGCAPLRRQGIVESRLKERVGGCVKRLEYRVTEQWYKAIQMLLLVRSKHITTGVVALLKAIRVSPDMNASQLARLLNRDRSNTHRDLRKLLSAELVDARGEEKRYRVTVKGLELLESRVAL